MPFSKSLAQISNSNTPVLNHPDYNFTRYNSENGLPQNSVNDLLLDKNHFLWIATHNGLVRFDGQRFRVYNSSNTPVLRSNRFPLLSESTDGRVLIKSSFDDSVIYTVTPGYDVIKEKELTRLQKKLISYHSNGIFDFDRLVAKLAARQPSQLQFSDRLYHSEVFWIFNDHEVVIKYLDDYYYVNSLEPCIRKLAWKPDIAGNTKGFVIGDLFCLAAPGGYFAFYKHGMPVGIRPDTSVLRLFKGYEKMNVVQFYLHVKGGRTILRRNNDFYYLLVSGSRLHEMPLFSNLSFLENQPICSLEFDSASKILFLGSQVTGLVVVRPRLFHCIGFNSKDYSNNSFMAIRPLSNHRILTSNGILDCQDPGKDRLFANDEKIDRYCIFQSRDGEFWCSKDKRLLRSDPGFLNPVPVDSSELDSYITCMTEDSGGVYWISTLHSLLKWERGKLRNVLAGYPPFVDHTIESIADIAPQELWIATRNGLFAFNKTTERIDPKPLLPDTYVRTIFKDREGGLYVGTYGSGFFRYWNGRFISLALDPQKYLATAHAFLEDGNGFLWISTNHGLFEVSKADLQLTAGNGSIQPFIYYYDRSSGFETNEFNGGCNPAAVHDSSGHFYFPSMDGVVCFSPDSCHPDLPDRPLFIDAFQVDSVPLDYHHNISINPDFNRIVVQVSTPFYGAGENLQIEYSFNNTAWYLVNPDGKIIFNRLPYGKYTFHIRKKNGWGKDNYFTFTIPFEVLPHWYNMPLYWLILWAGFLLLVLRIRTKFLRTQNMRLQMKVDQRTFELEKSILIRENLFSVIMHDLRSPMNGQNLLIEHLYKQHEKLGPAEMDHILFELLNSNKNILRFSSDFLVWYDSQKEDFAVNKSSLLLRPFVDAILQFYYPIGERMGLSVTCEVDPRLKTTTDEHLLGIVLRNIIDNAIKNTSSGGIHLTAYLQDGRVAISIRDTGRGMTSNEIKNLTDPYFQMGKKTGESFGYRFIREFSHLLGAELSISSNPGFGTTVVVSLDA